LAKENGKNKFGIETEIKHKEKMILTIAKRSEKEFTGKDGETRPYFWYVGKKADGLALRFGSSDGSHKVGDKKDFFLEEKEYSNGGKGFSEIVIEEDPVADDMPL